MTPGPITISTSERILFKRCRRKWDFQSKNRQSLVPKDRPAATPLWLGSGFHFALEDYHGYNRFGKPSEAFMAYVGAHKRSELPDDHKEATTLAVGMLDYYVDYWLPQHGETFQTLWIDDVPQVEVNLIIPLDLGNGLVVLYSLTFDRVAIDPYGRIVIIDYKTAQRQYEAGRLELDPQVSSYYWGGRILYGDKVEGACWTQFIKAVAHEPLVLVSGELSMDKKQFTTAAIYRDTLIKYYGTVPQKYVDFLNYLAAQETPEGDRYIRREIIYRNQNSFIAEEQKIFAEARDMVNPELPLYPNPIRDCTWDCNFRAPCLAMDDGSDYEYMLKSEYDRWEGEGYKTTGWREKLNYPPPLTFEAVPESVD